MRVGVRGKLRKIQQKRILELVTLLHEVHGELVRLEAECNKQAMANLLGDCQEFAVHIGTYIEEIEGVGTATVTLLEEYCDMLYFTNVAINDGDGSTNDIGRLQNQADKIEHSVRNELKPNKFEIAFLPYKASMWDSCESVWLAAKDDPECDAYVVPIPYFDRLPGGALGQMHYEGDQYPGDVPITDWRSYNIEERHPDVIITVNPYDDSNFVTMVHPDYFNKRLKDLTDQLVYIPYFVTIDDVADHFCTCAGVLYADRVVVQSDKIRDMYIRAFKQFEQANGYIGLFGKAEEKIITLGSPKFDKVLNTKREDCDIPGDWRRLIERADGSRKKVILYNTSIASLLEGNEMVLNKLQVVFELFEKRDDIVLLWRPHPLNQSTYQSMRPHLFDEYERIIQDYKDRQIGIYDDTADLHRAIALSDGYYGDSGSLVALYACTGKPMMAQDISNLSGDEASICPLNIYDDGQSLWFSVRDHNGLFRVDKDTMVTDFMGSFDEVSNEYLYYDIAEWDNMLYFAPFNADHIGVYDKVKQQFRKILLQHEERLNWLLPGKNRYFAKVVQYKKYMFFVAHTYPAIVRYDTETGKITYCTDWLHHVERKAKQSPWNNQTNLGLTHDFDGLLHPGRAIVGSEIISNLFASNELMFFNMETLSHQFYAIGKQNERYYGVCYDGEYYWLAARTGNYVVKWKREIDSYEKIDLPDYVTTGYAFNFRAIAYTGGYVWLIPNQASTALKIDVRNHCIYQASETDPFVTNESAYVNVVQSDDAIYAFKKDHIMHLDVKREQLHVHSFSLAKKDVETVMRWKMEAFWETNMQASNVKDMLQNEERTSIGFFLNFVKESHVSPFFQDRSYKQIELCSKMASHLNGKSGQAIYEFSKQMQYAGAGGKR